MPTRKKSRRASRKAPTAAQKRARAKFAAAARRAGGKVRKGTRLNITAFYG